MDNAPLPGEMPSTNPNPAPQKKKNLLILFIIFILAFICIPLIFFALNLAKASPVTQQSLEPLYTDKITVGYVFWPGYIGLIVASENGYFNEEKLNVEVKPYATLSEVSKDYTSGDIEGKANLTSEAIIESMNGFKHEAVLVFDYSNGSDGIIASPLIKSFSQIKNKKVGYEFGTLEEFFLRYALTENNLQISDVKGVNLGPEAAAKALINKEIDVAVTYEPFMSPALRESQGNVLFTSAEAPGLITDILTFNKEFIEENPATIQAFVRAYFKGIEYVKANPQEAYEILARVYSTTPEDVEQQLAGVKVLDLRENKVAFTFATGLQSLYGNLRTVEQSIGQTDEVMKKRIDTDLLVNPLFIREL